MIPSNNLILTIKPYLLGERKAKKTNTKTILVNKANRPHKLIKDGLRTLIKIDLFKVSGYLWIQTNVFLSLPHQKKTTRNQMVSIRNKTTMNKIRKNCSAMLVAGIIEMLTCHANAS